jgi:hypothetical protein
MLPFVRGISAFLLIAPMVFLRFALQESSYEFAASTFLPVVLPLFLGLKQ